MRILITIMILWSSTMAFGQEIWQLSPWAPDSSYVIGAMNSGEPTWVKVDSLGLADSIYLSGDSIMLRDGSGFVILKDTSSTNELQTISTNGNPGNISLSNTGGTLNLNVNDADANPSNEIQDLSLSGNTLSLTGDGTTVDLSSYLDNTDNQDLSLSGQTLSLTNDPTPVTLPIIDVIQGTGVTVTKSNGVVTVNATGGSGSTEYLDPYIISSDTVGFTHALGTDTTTVIINNCAGESLSMSNLENLSDAGATQGNTINLTNVGINTSDPKFSLDVNGVDGIRVPCGTTAQRPYAPEKGVIRFNTSTNKFEGWNGTKWVRLSLF